MFDFFLPKLKKLPFFFFILFWLVCEVVDGVGTLRGLLGTGGDNAISNASAFLTGCCGMWITFCWCRICIWFSFSLLLPTESVLDLVDDLVFEVLPGIEFLLDNIFFASGVLLWSLYWLNGRFFEGDEGSWERSVWERVEKTWKNEKNNKIKTKNEKNHENTKKT